MRHIDDDERRARLARPPRAGGTGRRHRGRRPRDDLPARDRAGVGPPRRLGTLGCVACRGRRRSLRRPLGGQAARDATYRLRLPTRPPAGRVGQRERPGGGPAGAPTGRGDGGGGRDRRRCGVDRRAPRPDPAADRDRGTAHHRRGARRACPRSTPGSPAARVPTRPTSRSPPRWSSRSRRAGAIVRGENDGGWKTSRPRWTATAAWLGETPASAPRARGVRRAGDGLAALVRPRHRGRPGLVAGLDQGRRTPCPRRGGGRRGLPRRRRHRLGAARRPRPGARPRPLGGAPARARPHHDGLEGARLPPRRRTSTRSSTATATAARPPGANGRIVGVWCQRDDGEVEVVLAEKVPVATRRALDAEGGRAHRVARRRRGPLDLPLPAGPAAPGESGLTRHPTSLTACATSPSSRRPRSSGCGCATPSAAGSASPATATSAGPSSARWSGPGSRWPTPRGSTRIPGSPTPAPRPPARPARRSTSRSAWPSASTPTASPPTSTRHCPTASTC